MALSSVERGLHTNMATQFLENLESSGDARARLEAKARAEEVRVTHGRQPKIRWLRYFRSLSFFLITMLEVFLYEIALVKIFPEAVRKGRNARTTKFARRFRRHAIKMGGVMIKLGQFISSRVDIIPREIINELSGLQDEVPPEDLETTMAILEDELGAPPEEIFERFNREVHAAASLGQVYRAQLKNGEKVVVKVLRPSIVDIVATDLSVLRIVMRIIMVWKLIARRADMPALLEEFAEILWQELNYRAEAQNAKNFKEYFADDPGIYIPDVYEAYSTDRVITLEDVTSIKISDLDAMDEAGIDRTEAAERMFNTYMRMIFDFSEFHADPHPGNLFIYPLPDADADMMYGTSWRGNGYRPFYVIFVDFGMVGQITDAIRSGLWETMIAVGTKDTKRMLNGYQKLGVLLPTANMGLLQQAQDEALSTVWGKSTVEMVNMSEEEMAYFGRKYRDLLYDMPFQVPQDFIYLARAVGMLSGLCVTLDPTFNPWGLIGRYARRFMMEESRRADGTTGILQVAAVWIRERMSRMFNVDA